MSATGWPTNFYGEREFIHKCQQDVLLVRESRRSGRRSDGFAAARSESWRRITRTHRQRGFSRIAGRKADVAQKTEVSWIAPPSAGGLRRGARNVSLRSLVAIRELETTGSNKSPLTEQTEIKRRCPSVDKIADNLPTCT